MNHSEFVFALPGNPDRTFSLDFLNKYDEILAHEFHEWEANVRRGYVMVFQLKQNGHDSDPRPMSLGTMSVKTVKEKFI